MHAGKVVLANLLDTVLVDVQRGLRRSLVQFVYLSFLLKDILSLFFVFSLAHVERLDDILAHLLLLEVVLPLFYLKLLPPNLVQVLHHLLFMTQVCIFLVHGFLNFVLAHLHIFQLDLAGNERFAFVTFSISHAKVEKTIRVAS